MRRLHNPRTPVVFATSITLLSLCVGCSRGPELNLEEWRESVESFRNDRQERLRKPDSWLTLVGLYWMEPGANSFGSDPSNDMVFPETAPRRLGTIYYDPPTIRLEPVSGTEMTVDGLPAQPVLLQTDRDDSTTIMEWKSMQWYLIQRDDQVGLRLKDSLSGERLNFAGLEFYDLDPSWRLDSRFEKYDPPRTIPVPTILGTVSNSPSPGSVVFERDGVEYALQAVGNPDDDEYFLIFADQTNGSETYGGGRFLYAEAPDSLGSLVVDFNLAYSPPCVFSPYATCPLPPPGNSLALAVEAGEKMYRGDASH